jgi:hypothetical protein
VQVVVQQPLSRSVAICRAGTVGQGTGVLAKQVVQAVTAGHGLADQVLVIQLIEAAASLIQAGAIQGGSGVSVEVRAGNQPEAAEQPLLGRCEVGVGQIECGGDTARICLAGRRRNRPGAAESCGLLCGR